jgi:hypothetical protein
LGAKPGIIVVNAPIPEPFVVLGFAIVGFSTKLQQTPRAETGDPPSELILPPLTASNAVIAVAGVVVSVAKEGDSAVVVNEICGPYDVPAAFVE